MNHQIGHVDRDKFKGQPLWNERTGRGFGDQKHLVPGVEHGGRIFPLAWSSGTVVVVADDGQVPWTGQPLVLYAPELAASAAPAKEEPIIVNFPPGSRVRRAEPSPQASEPKPVSGEAPVKGPVLRLTQSSE